jgi:hypothetical protein
MGGVLFQEEAKKATWELQTNFIKK